MHAQATVGTWSPEWVTSQPEEIVVPRAPEPPQRSPFPVFAAVMPVIAALAIWVFTQSPFAMVFALIGPVVALASVGDSRRRARTDSRRELSRFERDLVASIHQVDDAHERERALLEHRTPSAALLASSPQRNAERWRANPELDLTVRIGTGRADSSVKLVGDRVEHGDSPTVMAIAHLCDGAGILERAPLTVDARLGIGVCGAHPQVLAVANALVVQLAHLLSPVEFSVERESGTAVGLDWVSELPHQSALRSSPVSSQKCETRRRCVRVEFRARVGGRRVVLAIATDEASLPPECRIVVHVTGLVAQLVRHPGGAQFTEFAPEFVSDRQARVFAEVLEFAAMALPNASGHTLPNEVALNDLDQPRTRGRRALSACIGVDSNGEVVIDLVKDGPHAIVGGTTGSGKSELLVTWILAMAASHSPVDVNFLLVDFKGGASFSAVAGLPHTVGVLTDLDETAARRAILSLGAELGRRERILAESAARSMDELDDGNDLARLVIIVDEFATLTAQLPELHELFADLAARGRSLGIHLILCTQRPGASVRDAVLANCSLRVSLRVTSQADSISVIGTADAAHLPRHQVGRALLTRSDGEPELVQLAIATGEDVAEVENRWRGHESSPHRPWIDPLPAMLLPTEVHGVPAPAIAFGLVDVPEEQRSAVAVFDPVAHGNLLVVGGHHSGKTGVLAALAHGAVEKLIVPSSREGAWDAVAEGLSRIHGETRPMLILFDDVDELLGRISPDHESAFAERLSRLAREGPRAGVTLVLTAGAMRGRLQSIAALCESTLLLRLPSKQDHVLAGGSLLDYLPGLPPGGGTWRGHRVQVTFAGALPEPEARPVEELAIQAGNPLAVISSRPSAIRSRLERLGCVTMVGAFPRQGGELGSGLGSELSSGLGVNLGIARETTVLLGEPDAWQNAFAVLASLRTTARLVFHDCPMSDFRAITRSRDIPLPVDAADTLVVLDPDGRMFRATLPP